MCCISYISILLLFLSNLWENLLHAQSCTRQRNLIWIFNILCRYLCLKTNKQKPNISSSWWCCWKEFERLKTGPSWRIRPSADSVYLTTLMYSVGTPHASCHDVLHCCKPRAAGPGAVDHRQKPEPVSQSEYFFLSIVYFYMNYVATVTKAD